MGRRDDEEMLWLKASEEALIRSRRLLGEPIYPYEQRQTKDYKILIR
jgi:hypothetical protein